MRKTLFLYFIFLSFTPALFSQPALEWARQMGGTSFDHAHALALDDSGYIYVTGYFRGTADFDPGSGTFNLVSNGNREVFVCKLTNAGDLVWAKSWGGTGNDEGFSIFTDDSGNIYTTGYYTGTTDFDPDTSTYLLTSVNFTYDVFVSKLDASGNFLWAAGFGGPFSNDAGTSIAADSAGNVYLTGYFMDTVDFDPGPDTFYMASVAEDIFVSKLDAAGNFIWAKRIGGFLNYFDEGTALVLDEFANVYTAGWFNGTVDFDPGPGNYLLTATAGGWEEIYVSKLNSNGDFVWAKKMGGSSREIPNAMRYKNGNLFITGNFSSASADFDPGPGTFTLAAGSTDAFIVRLDTSGNFGWAKAMGGPSSTIIPYSIDADNNGNVYSTGYLEATADFDPGAGVFWLNNVAWRDVYVSKLDASGNFLWARQIGGTEDEEGTGIRVDANENVYLAGYFYESPDFDPTSGTFTLTATGVSDQYNDVFVCKWNNLALGFEEENLQSQYFLYPNPVRTQADLFFSNPGKENFSFELLDAYGKVVAVKTNIFSDHLTIQRQQLSSGIYFFRLVSVSGTSYSGKVMIE